MVLPISGRHGNAFAVEQRDAAPAVDQRLEVRLLGAGRRPPAFLANRAAVLEKFVENLDLFRVEPLAHAGLVALGAQALIAIQ